jgi:hypothetical protein
MDCANRNEIEEDLVPPLRRVARGSLQEGEDAIFKGMVVSERTIGSLQENNAMTSRERWQSEESGWQSEES